MLWLNLEGSGDMFSNAICYWPGGDIMLGPSSFTREVVVGEWWWWWWWWWCTKVNCCWIVAAPFYVVAIYSAAVWIGSDDCIPLLLSKGFIPKFHFNTFDCWRDRGKSYSRPPMVLAPPLCKNWCCVAPLFTIGFSVLFTTPRCPSLFIICVRPLNLAWNPSPTTIDFVVTPPFDWKLIYPPETRNMSPLLLIWLFIPISLLFYYTA